MLSATWLPSQRKERAVARARATAAVKLSANVPVIASYLAETVNREPRGPRAGHELRAKTSQAATPDLLDQIDTANK
jgi:hypothetical protein